MKGKDRERAHKMLDLAMDIYEKRAKCTSFHFNHNGEQPVISVMVQKTIDMFSDVELYDVVNVEDEKRYEKFTKKLTAIAEKSLRC